MGTGWSTGWLESSCQEYVKEPRLKILLLAHSFNGLTQRLFVDLREAGYQTSVELDIHDEITAEAISLFQPDLLIAPFLKRRIPETIWRQLPCLILHPGPPGDRGPSALDWALLKQEKLWGVTLLQANATLDGGDIWGFETFPMRNTTKAALYHQEVTDAASKVTLQAIRQFETGSISPQPQTALPEEQRRNEQPLMSQQARRIDWQQDSQESVLRKINSADGSPGLLDSLFGHPLYLYDAQPEEQLSGSPGEIIARSGPALCRATADGKGVWIGHLKDQQSSHPFKLPATQLLANELNSHPPLEEVHYSSAMQSGYREIVYEEESGVGLIHFNFYNGAMSTARCQQLQRALQQAKRRSTRAILLLGGENYWSNGMCLNQIEAAQSPADASWENINAMDDLALEILQSDHHLIISAVRGNAAAGGLFLARAADLIWARKGVILNPHYKDMGNLYGSEYWSYLLPKHAGVEHAQQISQARLPMGTEEAFRLGLIDQQFDTPHDSFLNSCKNEVKKLINQPDFDRQMKQRRQQRIEDEQTKPLARYRETELEKMRLNFYGFDPSYHIARYNFVHKIAKSRTPATIAFHRRPQGATRS